MSSHLTDIEMYKLRCRIAYDDDESNNTRSIYKDISATAELCTHEDDLIEMYIFSASILTHWKQRENVFTALIDKYPSHVKQKSVKCLTVSSSKCVFLWFVFSRCWDPCMYVEFLLFNSLHAGSLVTYPGRSDFLRMTLFPPLIWKRKEMSVCSFVVRVFVNSC